MKYSQLIIGSKYTVKNLLGETVCAIWNGNLWELDVGYLYPSDVPESSITPKIAEDDCGEI